MFNPQLRLTTFLLLGSEVAFGHGNGFNLSSSLKNAQVQFQFFSSLCVVDTCPHTNSDTLINSHSYIAMLNIIMPARHQRVSIVAVSMLAC